VPRVDWDVHVTINVGGPKRPSLGRRLGRMSEAPASRHQERTADDQTQKGDENE
jgi:hypothetical protein